MKSTDPCPWSLLETEFDAWLSEGQSASLWWRDDDAVAPGKKLDQLLDLSGNAGILLAVIPARLEPALVANLAGVSHAWVAQHGYAHINHAPRGLGLGAWELGMHRGEAAVLADLDAGRERLQNSFESCFLPVVVPPWNKLAPELLQPISLRGYAGVSAFGARTLASPAPGLTIVNAHCDPIRWKSGAHFAGELKTIRQLVDHLQARRTGLADATEPTGFLTHHIDLDTEGWDFCQKLASRVEQHAGAHWVSPEVIFEKTS